MWCWTKSNFSVVNSGKILLPVNELIWKNRGGGSQSPELSTRAAAILFLPLLRIAAPGGASLLRTALPAGTPSSPSSAAGATRTKVFRHLQLHFRKISEIRSNRKVNSVCVFVCVQNSWSLQCHLFFICLICSAFCRIHFPFVLWSLNFYPDFQLGLNLLISCCSTRYPKTGRQLNSCCNLLWQRLLLSPMINTNFWHQNPA